MKADWIGFEDALRTILATVEPLDPVSLPLGRARDCVLARDLPSPIDLPRWTNSAMDGFAVHSTSIDGASRETPVRLPIVDDVSAGGFPSRPLLPGEAARVMTGAPVPDGADSVIRVEHTDGGQGWDSGRPSVTIFEAQDARRNLRFKGEELRRGDNALSAGDVLSPAALGLAASIGYATVDVIRPPEVALLASGNELVDVDDFAEVAAGRKIVSSNSYTLAAQIEASGCRVRYLGIAEDSPASLRSALERATGADVVVTTAGISVGEHDYVREVLREMEADVAFWRVRMRPGSPFAFGRIGRLSGIPWFGLPGNPVSSVVTFELFVRPALLRMRGYRRVMRRRLSARLLGQPPTAPGLTLFLRVGLDQAADGSWVASLTGPQGSGILSSMVKADGLLIVRDGEARDRTDEYYEVIPLEPVWTTDEINPPARTRDGD